MHKETVRSVRFWRPGLMFAEDRARPVETFDLERIEWPEDAYCLQFEEREDIIDGGKTFTGEAKKIGRRVYHPHSKVETLAEVKANPKATPTLVANMECNGWDRIVWSRWGNWPQPFDPSNDEVAK